MTVAMILWGYAIVLATLGGALIRRARWVDRAPRLAIGVWQAVTFSSVLAVIFGGLAVIVSMPRLSACVANLTDSCTTAVQNQYATPSGLVMAAGGVLAAAVGARWAACTVAELFRATAVRRRHHEMLAIVGRYAHGDDVTLLDDDRPYVYCVAGRRRRIVVSTGARARLDPFQLAAALAHERAHLRQRHHLVLGGSAALARAFPFVPLFATAHDEVARLLELAADDAAGHSTHRLNLAEAMLNLSATPAPAGSLAVTGASTPSRVRRLIAGHNPVSVWTRALGVSTAVAVLAVPSIALAAPAIVAGTGCCPGGTDRVMAMAGTCPTAAPDPRCAAGPVVG